MNRRPSIEATSPPPQRSASSRLACSSTIRAFAAAIVSGRRSVARRSAAELRAAPGCLVHERRVADVAGLRDEHGAQTGGQALEPGVGLLVVGERVDESGLGGDLQHEVGQVGCGQQRVHAVPQRDQRCWLGERVERVEVQPSGRELKDGVLSVQPFQRPVIREIEIGRELLDERTRVGRQRE
jgi:hypothetical protein